MFTVQLEQASVVASYQFYYIFALFILLKPKWKYFREINDLLIFGQVSLSLILHDDSVASYFKGVNQFLDVLDGLLQTLVIFRSDIFWQLLKLLIF